MSSEIGIRFFVRQGRFQKRPAAVFCAADGAGAGADGRGPAAPLFILKLELPVVCFMQNGMVRRRTDEVFVGRVGFAEYDRGKFFVLSSVFNFLGKLGAARCFVSPLPHNLW